MVSPAIQYGLYAQRGINLLQVGALRIPCLMASVASVTRVAELALRAVSKTLEFFGFNRDAKFAQWVERGVDYVRPYKNEEQYSSRQLFTQAFALATIGVLGNTFVSALFGPPPEIYNSVLQWLGPIRVTADLHPLIDLAASRLGY